MGDRVHLGGGGVGFSKGSTGGGVGNKKSLERGAGRGGGHILLSYHILFFLGMGGRGVRNQFS